VIAFASLVLFLPLSLLHLLNCLHLKDVVTFVLPLLSPILLVGGVSGQLCGCLATAWGQPTTDY